MGKERSEQAGRLEVSHTTSLIVGTLSALPLLFSVADIKGQSFHIKGPNLASDRNAAARRVACSQSVS